MKYEMKNAIHPPPDFALLSFDILALPHSATVQNKVKQGQPDACLRIEK